MNELVQILFLQPGLPDDRFVAKLVEFSSERARAGKTYDWMNEWMEV